MAVRSLCDFAARRGDLSTRFTPAPTAQQGLAGHLIVGARRGPNYQREITLVGRHGSLMVRGRADGYDEGHHRLEEFKTHRGDLARMPANQRLLHWAQLKVYGAMLCAQRCLPDIELALIYFNIGSEKETALQERWVGAAAASLTSSRCASLSCAGRCARSLIASGATAFSPSSSFRMPNFAPASDTWPKPFTRPRCAIGV